MAASLLAAALPTKRKAAGLRLISNESATLVATTAATTASTLGATLRPMSMLVMAAAPHLPRPPPLPTPGARVTRRRNRPPAPPHWHRLKPCRRALVRRPVAAAFLATRWLLPQYRRAAIRDAPGVCVCVALALQPARGAAAIVALGRGGDACSALLVSLLVRYPSRPRFGHLACCRARRASAITLPKKGHDLVAPATATAALGGHCRGAANGPGVI